MLVYAGRVYTASLAEKEMERLFLEILPGTEFEGTSYAVGGYVRDEVMGIDSKDLDIVVGFEGGAGALGKYIRKLFGPAVSTPRQMGAYPIWNLVFKENVTWDGQDYQTKGGELDLADSQKESFPDEESRQRLVEFGTVEEDVERRDFTVNMLLKDLTTGEMVDLSGTSVNDIQEGILRTHPDVPPDQPFEEDPLRMMRLVRFMAKYGWDAAPETVEAVKRNAHRIEIVSSERVRDELVKVMKVGKLGHAVRFMAETGLLQLLLPEIQALRGVEQSPQHHSEGDVFEHTLAVLENAKPTVDAQLAALLHDTGKPSTQEFLEDRIRFLGHEEVSEEIAEAVLRRLKFDNTTTKKVVTLVRNHMRPHQSAKWKPKTVRKFMRELGDYLEDVLDLAEADALGSMTPEGTPAKSPTGLRERVRDMELLPAPAAGAKPPLSGHDVMRLLEVPPGAEVGKAMRWLVDKVDDWAVEGREMSPEDAEELLLREYAPQRV